MKFIQMCIENGFFTCGSNEQYQVVIDFYNALCRLICIRRRYIDMLVSMIYICSDVEKISCGVIYIAVHKLFADKEIIS